MPLCRGWAGNCSNRRVSKLMRMTQTKKLSRIEAATDRLPNSDSSALFLHEE
ncbi:hypothetical protein CCHR01_12489 [Colletotrichum chrysophilum]|uniref:Uncharacterized protein n=1 Tax=Colletotrichum chrysophilum TaxID=1836956 RepID=A0AAD9ABT7_9PEZI|nr:hypothetical protein CCHR01_12489 [Colletotrichum chrysophilum]